MRIITQLVTCACCMLLLVCVGRTKVLAAPAPAEQGSGKGSRRPASSEVAAAGGFAVRADLEAAFFKRQGLRFGAGAGLVYDARNWSFEAGIAGFYAMYTNAILLVGYPDGPPIDVDGAAPGEGVVGRLAAARRLLRAGRFSLLLGTSLEADYSEPFIFTDTGNPDSAGGAQLGLNLVPWLETRVQLGRLQPSVRLGWRQPLLPFDVEAVAPLTKAIESRRVRVDGTFVVALGVVVDVF